MKIKLSKSQWEGIGKTAGWIKNAEENSEDDLTESIEDKMKKATYLAFQCAYATLSPDGTYLHPKEIDLPEEVWHWADGLTQDYIMRNIEGRTSLKNIMEFDMGKTEEMIDDTIKLFEETLTKVGSPKKLSKEEYHAMGYRS
jgi:hypothetical protein